MKALLKSGLLALLFLLFLLGGPIKGQAEEIRYIIAGEEDEAIFTEQVKEIEGLHFIDSFVGEPYTYVIAEGTDEVIDQARSLPTVVFIEEDNPLSLVTTPSVSATASSFSWGISQIEADRLLTENCRCKIAIIDSGISRHSLLDAAVKKKITFINGTTVTGVATDDTSDGHGTHVAGIIAGKTTNVFTGISQDAGLYIVKALDKNGDGYMSDLAKGIRWAMGEGVGIINLSLGTDRTSQTLELILREAYEKGVVVVAATGNDGGPVQYPASSPYTIAVGAADQALKMPTWSAYGSQVDILAPGVRINSTGLNQSFLDMSGTSMASPHVTGAISKILPLYKGANSAARVEWVRNRLIDYSMNAYKSNGQLLTDVGFLNLYRSFYEVKRLPETTTVILADGTTQIVPIDQLMSSADAYNRISIQTTLGEEEWQLGE